MEEQIRKLLSALFNRRFDRPINVAAVKQQPNVKTFVHREKEVIVAMVTLYTVQLFSRHLGVIEEVVTLPEYRNNGIATNLIKRAIADARMQGCTCIELTVREDRPDVQDFYKSLGFRDRNNRAFALTL